MRDETGQYTHNPRSWIEEQEDGALMTIIGINRTETANTNGGITLLSNIRNQSRGGKSNEDHLESLILESRWITKHEPKASQGKLKAGVIRGGPTSAQSKRTAERKKRNKTSDFYSYS